MMPQINHILYATDLSENSAYAFRYAINSALHHNAKISLLHVLEQLPATAGVFAETMLSQEQLQNLRNEKRTHTIAQIRRRLKIVCEKEMPDDPECQDRLASILVTEGLAADEILQKSDEMDCDAIVAATREKSGGHTFLPEAPP